MTSSVRAKCQAHKPLTCIRGRSSANRPALAIGWTMSRWPSPLDRGRHQPKHWVSSTGESIGSGHACRVATDPNNRESVGGTKYSTTYFLQEAKHAAIVECNWLQLRHPWPVHPSRRHGLQVHVIADVGPPACLNVQACA